MTEDAATAKKKDQFPASHMNMKRTIFIDFDGTITRVDTCNAMLKAFASDGWQEINEQWERGELATQACARQLFQLFKPPVVNKFSITGGKLFEYHWW